MASRMRRDGLPIRPFLENSEVIQLTKEIFGLKVSKIEELDSYDDRNFLIEACPVKTHNEVVDNDIECPKKFVFKVMNSRDTYSSGFLDATISAMQHFDKYYLGQKYSCPVPIPSLSGSFKDLLDFRIPDNEKMKIESSHLKNKINGSDKFLNSSLDDNGQDVFTMKHYVRLLSFVPGKIFPCGELDDDLLFQTGKLAANIVKVFKDFSHPALVNKQDIWDMKNLLELRKPKYLDPLKDVNKRKMAETVFSLFEDNVASVISNLPMQTIHSDLNEQNIIIKNHNGRREITGLIDFGDITHSCRIFEIGICISYIGLLKVDDFNQIAGTILAGYLSEEELTQVELDVLYYCIIGRLAMSLVMGNYQYSLSDSSNDYLLNTSKKGWKLLDILLESKECVKKIVGVWLGYCKEKTEK